MSGKNCKALPSPHHTRGAPTPQTPVQRGAPRKRVMIALLVGVDIYMVRGCSSFVDPIPNGPRRQCRTTTTSFVPQRDPPPFSNTSIRDQQQHSTFPPPPPRPPPARGAGKSPSAAGGVSRSSGMVPLSLSALRRNIIAYHPRPFHAPSARRPGDAARPPATNETPRRAAPDDRPPRHSRPGGGDATTRAR